MAGTTREVHLVRRPQGWPDLDDFALVGRPVPELGDGQVLVRNTFLSVDPYMRGRMSDRPSYVPPYALGEAMDGGAVGEVVASRAHGVAEGDLVLHGLGWREHAVLDGARVRVLDANAAPSPSAYLGVLGMTGLTAYTGLVAVAQLRPGETVFVSGAAGAVGSTAVQLARLLGAGRVVGSAGGPAKASRVVQDFGADAAIDYRAGSVPEQLSSAAPDGVDVYFDNVGGEQLEAAIGAMSVGGRIAACGSIAQYNAAEPTPAPRNLGLVVGKRLTLRGFLVFDHDDLRPEFLATVEPWLRKGRLIAPETVVEGIDHAAEAFLSMMRGGNTGKMVVRVG